MAKRSVIPLLIICAFLLIACQTSITSPQPVGYASPDALAKSLATVDPSDHLHLFEYDTQQPLDIQEERRWQENGVTWIDFSYASPKGGRVPSRIVVPSGRGPFPAIILQHGGLGTYEDMDELALDFARLGALVLATTAPYSRPGVWQPTQYMGYTWPFFTEEDLEIKIQMIIDLRRGIDLLIVRPDVDPERMAYLGNSFGGAMGGLLSGVDHRLAAYVLHVGDGGLVEHTSDPDENGLPVHFSEKWAQMMWPTESLHYIGLSAPAAILFQNGIHDPYTLPHDALRYQAAASQPKTVMWYDSGHGLPRAAFSDAMRWLQPYLGEDLTWFTPNYWSSALILDRVFTAWLAIAGLTLVYFLVSSVRMSWPPKNDTLVNSLLILLLGPLGLYFIWRLLQRNAADKLTTQLTTFHRYVLGASLYTCTAGMAGFYLGNIITDRIPGLDFRLNLLLHYVFGLLICGMILLVSRHRYRVTVFAGMLTWNVYWCFMTLVNTLIKTCFSFTWVPGFTILWLYSIVTLLATLLAYPFHSWLLRRGLIRWRFSPDDQWSQGESRFPHWALRSALLLFSFLLIPASFVLIVKVYTQFLLQKVVSLFLGQY
jgi:dienelactone hydrolase